MQNRNASVLLVLSVALSLASPSKVLAQSASRPVKDKWALIVGVSKFDNQAINLQYAAKDAEDFSKFLINEAHFAPDHVHVLLNEDATRENILSELGDKWLPHVVQPDDVALIFISSHGSPSSMDVEGINYVVASNTDPDRLYATGISMQELATTIKERVHSDRVVIVLDACHSGSARTSDKGLKTIHNFNADNVAQGTGQLVICSSAPNQVSWESKKYNNGVFTHHLIAALKNKPRFDEAFAYLHDGVQTEVLQDRGELQTPMVKSKWTGASLMLTALPSSPRPGLPGNVLHRTAPSPRPPTVPPVTIATPSVARAVPATTQGAGLVAAQPKPLSPTVSAAPAEWGKSVSNRFVRMKVLDVEQKMTGFFITMEIENQTGPPTFDPYNMSFEGFSKGYYTEKRGGSSIWGGGAYLPPGQKRKLEFSTVEPIDEVLVKFQNIGWQPLKFRLTTESAETPSFQSSAPQATLNRTANYGEYASNGFVRMKALSTEQRMTGFFMTLELVNDTQEPVEPYNIKYNFSKDGYSLGSRSGSGVYGSDLTLPPGRHSKMDMSESSVVDSIEVKFPKPNWPSLTLRLK